eukprot:4550898-Pyramimonas_sp.AAC.1
MCERPAPTTLPKSLSSPRATSRPIYCCPATRASWPGSTRAWTMRTACAQTMRCTSTTSTVSYA